MSNADIVSISSMLAKGKKRPEEVFHFYRPDPDEVDLAEVVDFHPQDEADDVDPKNCRVVRRCSVGSASNETIRRWEESCKVVESYIHAEALERAKRQEAAIEGKAYEGKPVPKPIEAEGSHLRILLSRFLAEGLFAWDPAPKAVVAVPSLKIKRGDRLPLPSEYLPEDPSDYGPKAHAELLSLVDAIPSRLSQKLYLGVSWTSQLDIMRFVRKEIPEREAGKESASPSPTPSSEAAAGSGSGPEGEASEARGDGSRATESEPGKGSPSEDADTSSGG